MTSHEWQRSTDPLAMLEELYPLRGMDSIEPQTRKSRLYLLACARSAWPQLPGVCRAVIELAEKVYGELETNKSLRDQVYPLAEGLIHCRGEAEEINAINRQLVALGFAKMQDVWAEADIAPTVWRGLGYLAFAPFDRKTPNFPRIPTAFHSVGLLREVFGNPLIRVAPFNAEWRTDTVVRLAQHAHTRDDFTMFPILADALQDAGCTRKDILDHLRYAGPHCRGCWALEEVRHVL